MESLRAVTSTTRKPARCFVRSFWRCFSKTSISLSPAARLSCECRASLKASASSKRREKPRK